MAPPPNHFFRYDVADLHFHALHNQVRHRIANLSNASEAYDGVVQGAVKRIERLERVDLAVHHIDYISLRPGFVAVRPVEGMPWIG